MNILNWTARVFVALTAYTLIAAFRPSPHHPVVIHQLTQNPPPQHHVVTGTISAAGIDQMIALTPITGCIANNSGDCDVEGRFVKLHNGSSRTPVHWSSEHACMKTGDLNPSQMTIACLNVPPAGEKSIPFITITIEYDE